MMKKTNKLLLIALALTSPAIAQNQDAQAAWNNGDYSAAVRIWTPAANQGDADAMYRIAIALQEGKGVNKNIPLATDLLMRSSSLGSMLATSHLGLMLYKDGRKAQAMYYLKQAAGNQDARAAYLVGVSLFNGDSVQEDRESGILFLRQAAKAGFEPANKALEQIDISPIEEDIKPIQSKSYTIRLGAFRINGNAEKLWNSLSDKIRFGDHSPTLTRFKDLTLLRVRGFTRNEAQSMCIKIKASGNECIIE